MASSRVCMKPGCRRRMVWRAGHDPQRHLAGVCYVCWGERVRESAGPNRQARHAWRQVARASWCCHCAMTVPWAAHWIAAGHCVVRQEGFKIERPEGRAQLVRGTAIPAPSPTEMRPSRGSTPFEDGAPSVLPHAKSTDPGRRRIGDARARISFLRPHGKGRGARICRRTPTLAPGRPLRPGGSAR